MLDAFIARRGIDLDAAAEAASLSDADLARRLVDVDHSRDELVRLSRGRLPRDWRGSSAASTPSR